MRCAEKFWFLNAKDAERHRRQLMAKATDKQAARRLVVYPCRDCGRLHVGHLRNLVKAALVERPAPAPKPASVGELRRKLERMARQWERQEDYQRRQRAEAIGKLIAAEQAIEDAKREYVELQRQTLKLFFPEMR